MDELRGRIWDYLFCAREPKSLDEVAIFVGLHSNVISAAVDHEWFQTADGKVAIAYEARPVSGVLG